MKSSEIRARLIIDRNALDDELVGQADLYYRASEAYAAAVNVRDGLKLFLKQTDARLTLKYAKELAKPTVANVAAAVADDSDHVVAVQDVADLIKNVTNAEALKEAMRHRGYMLRTLCDLAVSGYFSPSSGGAVSSNSNRAGEYESTREKLGAARRGRSEAFKSPKRKRAKLND